MKLILTALVLVLAFVSAPTDAQAQANPPITLPVTGLGDGVTFVGDFDLEEFEYEDGVISAVGTVTGTLLDADGNVVGIVEDLPVTIPLTDLTATCDLLHLEIGPIDLDLLGLVVALDPIVLDIDAEAAPGNLLGNLLCGLAHLLDSNASGNAIARRLDRILAIVSEATAAPE